MGRYLAIGITTNLALQKKKAENAFESIQNAIKYVEDNYAPLDIYDRTENEEYVMFKIKKKIHSETKPDWVVCVLYKIPPRVYDWQESHEACMKHLIIIKDILEKSSVKWHGGNHSLTKIRNLKVEGGCLHVLTKSGRNSLSFNIIEE